MSIVPISPPSLDPNNVNYNITGTNTWSQTSNSALLPGYIASSVSQSANGQFILVTSVYPLGGPSASISISSDFGANWRRIVNGDPAPYFYTAPPPSTGGLWTASAVSSTGQYMTICSSDGYVYYSASYGTQWAQKVSPTTYSSTSLPVNFTSIAISSNGQYVYACSTPVTGGAPGRVYVSSQILASPQQVPTTTGTSVGLIPDNIPWTSITCSSDGSVAFVCASDGNLYGTNRYGTSWYQQGVTGTPLPTTLPWTSVAMSSTFLILVLCASNGDVYTTTNGGYQWTQVQSTSFDPQITGANWNSVSISSTGQYMVLSNSSTSNANNPVYVSSDQGVTWTQIPFPTNPTSITGVSMSSSGQYLVTAGIISTASNVFTVSVNEDIGNIYGSQIALLEASQPLGNGLANTLSTTVYLGSNITINGNGCYNFTNGLNNDMYFNVANTSDGNSGTFYFENGGYATGPTLNLANGYTATSPGIPDGFGSIVGVNHITFGTDVAFGQIGLKSSGSGQFTIETDDNMIFALNNTASTGSFNFQYQPPGQSQTPAELNCGQLNCANIACAMIRTYGKDISTQPATGDYGNIYCGSITANSLIKASASNGIDANGSNIVGVSSFTTDTITATGLIQARGGVNTVNTGGTAYGRIDCGDLNAQASTITSAALATGNINCGNLTMNLVGTATPETVFTVENQSSKKFEVTAKAGGTCTILASGLEQTPQSGLPMIWDTGGYISYQSSSARYKDDIVSLPDDRYNLETFMKLKPVQFVYKTNPSIKHIGFIAEEFDELQLDEITVYMDNKLESLDYSRIPIFLTKIVQEQQTKIDDLTSKLQALTDLVNSKLV
jgi:hypothetical protein